MKRRYHLVPEFDGRQQSAAGREEGDIVTIVRVSANKERQHVSDDTNQNEIQTHITLGSDFISMYTYLEGLYLTFAMFATMMILFVTSDTFGPAGAFIFGLVAAIVLFYSIPKWKNNEYLATHGYFFVGVAVTLFAAFLLEDTYRPFLSIAALVGIPVVWYYFIPKKYKINLKLVYGSN